MVIKPTIKLTKPQKLLLVIYDLSGGVKKFIPHTKIVVKAFKKYKDDFHLPGYPDYPDSESVSKELYRSSIKSNGLITYGNRAFSLSSKGVDYVSRLKEAIGRKKVYTSDKLDRYIDQEIKRIRNLDSLKYFLKGDYDKVLDTHFYNYLGVTVKAERSDFESRLNTLNDVISALKKTTDESLKIFIDFHNFMIKKFKKDIDYKLGT